MSFLTESQVRALNFSRHLAVTANAGSGKTTVLVQRFVDILLKTETRVNEIVAITFTEKAASELRKRIAGMIGGNIGESRNPQQLHRLEQIRDQLSSANICTIHSFCAKLLREYPVEANVDAAFTVIEEVDQQILVSESLREALEHALQNTSNGNVHEEVLYALRMLGKSAVEKYLTVFFSKREEIERLIRTEEFQPDSTDSEKILQSWNKEVEEFIATYLNDSLWRQTLNQLCSAAQGKAAQEVKMLFGEWNEEVGLEKKISLFGAIAEKIFTEKGLVKKDFMGRKVERDVYAPHAELLEHWYSSFQRVFGAYIDTKSLNANRTLLRLMQTLLKVYRNGLMMYDEKKSAQGKLDFEDLQLKTMKLLESDTIRSTLAQTYKYIMVDEYQDTNRLQDDILRRLISEFQSGNLFIVGDPKQSIYGFRHADVEIFEKTKHDMSSAKNPTDHHVILAESFRPLISIVDFVNRIFSYAMTDRTSKFDVKYEELISGRNTTEEGKVELLLLRSGNNHDEDVHGKNKIESVADECELIAQRITNLAESKHEIFEADTKGKASRPFQFKDAAILLRSRKNLRELERALDAYKIPYVISGGIGFYQTQEIFDFFNYFKFLLDPADDVALLGILRSPFFAVSDAELFEISIVKNEESFWEKVKKYSERGQSTRQLTYAIEILQDNLLLANRITIPQLVYRIIRQTGWQGAVAGLSFGSQRIANIEKLLRFAREFEQRGLTNLFDFVERLKLLVEEREREGQASIDVEGNAVKILTIHAAKGLEFPVVVIPFAHEEFRYDKPPFIDSSFGVAFKVKEEQNFDEEAKPAFYTYLQQRSRMKTEAEEKRVFYVACTRARDMLVISGNMQPGETSSSYLKWTLNGIDLSSESLKGGSIKLPKHEVSVLVHDGKSYTSSKIQHSLTVNVITAKEQIPVKGKLLDVSREVGLLGQLFIEPLASTSQGEFYSATQIKTFLECPTKYYLKYRLGLPEEQSAPYDFDDDGEPNDTLFGELEGTLTHAVLQHLTNSEISDEDIRKQARSITASAIARNEPHFETIANSVFQNVLSFKNSEIGEKILSSSETKTEYSVNACFGEDYLTGTIDRLYKNDQGQWCIADYKTDRVDTKDIQERASIYKPQLALYALLVHKLYGQESTEATLLFLHSSVPYQFLFSPAELDDFEKTVQEVIRKIKNRDFARSVAMCDSCSYQKDGNCLVK